MVAPSTGFGAEGHLGSLASQLFSSRILNRLFEVTCCVLTGRWSYSWLLPRGAAGKATRDIIDCAEQCLQCRQTPRSVGHSHGLGDLFPI